MKIILTLLLSTFIFTVFTSKVYSIDNDPVSDIIIIPESILIEAPKTKNVNNTIIASSFFVVFLAVGYLVNMKDKIFNKENDKKKLKSKSNIVIKKKSESFIKVKRDSIEYKLLEF